MDNALLLLGCCEPWEELPEYGDVEDKNSLVWWFFVSWGGGVVFNIRSIALKLFKKYYFIFL